MDDRERNIPDQRINGNSRNKEDGRSPSQSIDYKHLAEKEGNRPQNRYYAVQNPNHTNSYSLCKITNFLDADPVSIRWFELKYVQDAKFYYIKGTLGKIALSTCICEGVPLMKEKIKKQLFYLLDNEQHKQIKEKHRYFKNENSVPDLSLFHPSLSTSSITCLIIAEQELSKKNWPFSLCIFIREINDASIDVRCLQYLQKIINKNNNNNIIDNNNNDDILLNKHIDKLYCYSTAKREIISKNCIINQIDIKTLEINYIPIYFFSFIDFQKIMGTLNSHSQKNNTNRTTHSNKNQSTKRKRGENNDDNENNYYDDYFANNIHDQINNHYNDDDLIKNNNKHKITDKKKTENEKITIEFLPKSPKKHKKYEPQNQNEKDKIIIDISEKEYEEEEEDKEEEEEEEVEKEEKKSKKKKEKCEKRLKGYLAVRCDSAFFWLCEDYSNRPVVVSPNTGHKEDDDDNHNNNKNNHTKKRILRIKWLDEIKKGIYVEVFEDRLDVRTIITRDVELIKIKKGEYKLERGERERILDILTTEEDSEYEAHHNKNRKKKNSDDSDDSEDDDGDNNNSSSSSSEYPDYDSNSESDIDYGYDDYFSKKRKTEKKNKKTLRKQKNLYKDKNRLQNLNEGDIVQTYTYNKAKITKLITSNNNIKNKIVGATILPLFEFSDTVAEHPNIKLMNVLFPGIKEVRVPVWKIRKVYSNIDIVDISSVSAAVDKIIASKKLNGFLDYTDMINDPLLEFVKETDGDEDGEEEADDDDDKEDIEEDNDDIYLDTDPLLDEDSGDPLLIESDDSYDDNNNNDDDVVVVDDYHLNNDNQKLKNLVITYNNNTNNVRMEIEINGKELQVEKKLEEIEKEQEATDTVVMQTEIGSDDPLLLLSNDNDNDKEHDDKEEAEKEESKRKEENDKIEDDNQFSIDPLLAIFENDDNNLKCNEDTKLSKITNPINRMNNTGYIGSNNNNSLQKPLKEEYYLTPLMYNEYNGSFFLQPSYKQENHRNGEPPKHRKIRVLELFSGCGGLSFIAGKGKLTHTPKKHKVTNDDDTSDYSSDYDLESEEEVEGDDESYIDDDRNTHNDSDIDEETNNNNDNEIDDVDNNEEDKKVEISVDWSVEYDKRAVNTFKLNHKDCEVFVMDVNRFYRMIKLLHQVKDDLEKKIKRKENKEDSESEKESASESEEEENGYYEVEHIIGVRVVPKNKKYQKKISVISMAVKSQQEKNSGKHNDKVEWLVKWKGWDESYNSWEPEKNLRCPKRKLEYLKSAKCKIPWKGEVNMVIGGPPCQGVTGSNRFRDYKNPFNDPLNKLLLSFLKICKFYNPSFILLENVTDYWKFVDGILAKTLICEMLKMDYQVNSGILTTGEFGVPQHRKRCFFWGAKYVENLPNWPKPFNKVLFNTSYIKSKFAMLFVTDNNYKTTADYNNNNNKNKKRKNKSKKMRALTLYDVLTDLLPINNENKIADGNKKQESKIYFLEPQTPFQHWVRLSNNNNKNKNGGGIKIKNRVKNHECCTLADNNINRIKLVPKQKYASIMCCARGKKLPNGAPLIPFYALNRRYRQWCYRRVWYDEIVSTVNTQVSPAVNPMIHPHQDRILSVREIARCQGFPDWFKFDTSCYVKWHYKQLGNAVPPPVAMQLGKCLIRSCFNHHYYNNNNNKNSKKKLKFLFSICDIRKFRDKHDSYTDEECVVYLQSKFFYKNLQSKDKYDLVNELEDMNKVDYENFYCKGKVKDPYKLEADAFAKYKKAKRNLKDKRNKLNLKPKLIQIKYI